MWWLWWKERRHDVTQGGCTLINASISCALLFNQMSMSVFSNYASSNNRPVCFSRKILGADNCAICTCSRSFTLGGVSLCHHPTLWKCFQQPVRCCFYIGIRYLVLNTALAMLLDNFVIAVIVLSLRCATIRKRPSVIIFQRPETQS